MEETKNSNKMTMYLAVGALVVAIAVIGFVAFKGQSETNKPVATATPLTNDVVDDVKIINVEAGSFYFKPNEIRVKKGEKVKIVLSSVSMMHDFVVDELGIKVPVTKSGTTSEVVFTADKVGTFEYYCSVMNHRAQGQIGKLIVE